MSYKVKYYTLAKMPENKVGNIRQETGVVYTDVNIAEIPEKLNKFLSGKNRVGVIEAIERVEGVCL